MLYRLLSDISFKFLLRAHLGIGSTAVDTDYVRKSISVERYSACSYCLAKNAASDFFLQNLSQFEQSYRSVLQTQGYLNKTSKRFGG
jgi:hypothetical protein